MAVLGGVTHGCVGPDAVAVSTADSFALDVAGFVRSATMRWAARSVIPTLWAMSRNLAFGSRWMQRRDLGVVGEEPPRLVFVSSA